MGVLDVAAYGLSDEERELAGMVRAFADEHVAPRAYEAGERMINLGSTYGLTVWRWTAER